MKKKFIPLLISLPLLASSCGQLLPDNRVKISGNINTYLYQNENSYLAPFVGEISQNMKVGANFAIYFTNTGCSACEEFAPIMNGYTATSKMMIYKFDIANDKKEMDEFKSAYGDLFFRKDEQNNYIVQTPSLAIYHDSKVNFVDYDKYMRTSQAFNNHMGSTYNVSNVYFTKGDVFASNFVDCEFAYVYFDFANQSLMDLYKSKISRYVYSSSRYVIVSNYAEDEHIHLKLTGRSKGNAYSRKEYIVTSETSENIIKEVL